jgi:cation transport regulator ChaC
MTFYFAYGSNISRSDMAGRCPYAKALGVATLTGRRFAIGRDGYASVMPAGGATVVGVLWRLSARDLAVLNAYESIASGLYTRDRQMVRHNGAAVSALVYVARGCGAGRPRPGYMERVVEAAREWNFPADYVRMLQRLLSAGGGKRRRAP